MKIIGITGPSGAGKSIFSGFLAERSIPVINADELYHSLLIPPSHCLDLIRGAFGDGVFNADGTLSRPELAKIVFSSEEKLELLNSTVLSVVIDESKRIISALEAKGERMVAIDAPTLIESGFDKECDTVISILSGTEMRSKRISERDHISESDAMRRISAQKPDSFYKEHSDTVIFNDGDLESFRAAFEQIYASLISQESAK